MSIPVKGILFKNKSIPKLCFGPDILNKMSPRFPEENDAA